MTEFILFEKLLQILKVIGIGVLTVVLLPAVLLLGLWADENRQGGSQLDTYEEMEGRIDERA